VTSWIEDDVSIVDMVMDKIPWLRAVRAEQDRRDEKARALSPRVDRVINRIDRLAEEFSRAEKALKK
jgi:FMN-dependent NADH-azoreductase